VPCPRAVTYKDASGEHWREHSWTFQGTAECSGEDGCKESGVSAECPGQDGCKREDFAISAIKAAYKGSFQNSPCCVHKTETCADQEFFNKAEQLCDGLNRYKDDKLEEVKTTGSNLYNDFLKTVLPARQCKAAECNAEWCCKRETCAEGYTRLTKNGEQSIATKDDECAFDPQKTCLYLTCDKNDFLNSDQREFRDNKKSSGSCCRPETETCAKGQARLAKQLQEDIEKLQEEIANLAKEVGADEKAGKSADELRSKRTNMVQAEEQRKELQKCAAKDDEQCSADECKIDEFITITGKKPCCLST
jgi:hypothetical protein